MFEKNRFEVFGYNRYYKKFFSNVLAYLKLKTEIVIDKYTLQYNISNIMKTL